MSTGKMIPAKSHLYVGVLLVVVVFLSSLTLTMSVNHAFDHDEFEHVHSAWYILNGHAPYSDFYQVHHPLLWYLMTPVLSIFGNTVETLVITRAAIYVLALGIAFATYEIARRATASREAGLLSVILLQSMVMFSSIVIQIRPDVPQVLLGLISVYCLVGFLQTDDIKYVVAAGLSASVSFLFLQKSLFLLVAYAIILTYGLLRRRISIRSVLWFIASVSLPLVLFLGQIAIVGSFHDYILTGWILHIRWLETSPLPDLLLGSFTEENSLFWLLLPLSVAFVLLNRRTNDELKATVFIGTVMLMWPLTKGRPHAQDFMLAIPLLCIAIAYFLSSVCDRLRLGAVGPLVLIALVVVQPLSFLLPERMRTDHRRRYQLAKIPFVIENSESYDLVYDGDAQFNLYRHDLHYFWFSVVEGGGLDTYNALTNNKYGGYDICELIKSKQPTFASDHELDVVECGLRHLYEKTAFPDLYVKRETTEAMQFRRWPNLGEVLVPLRYSMAPRRVRSGEAVQVTLWWEALTRPEKDYTAFIHVIGPDGRIWAQHDVLLQNGDRPTSAWEPREIVRQDHVLRIAADAPPGEYVVVGGVYYWETQQRLPVWDEEWQRVPDDMITVGSITVAE